jgi:hypothetical protein
MGLGSRADIATLGLAISLVTSASVSLSSCFLVFFFIRHNATRANRLQFNSDHVWPLGSLFVKLRDWWGNCPMARGLVWLENRAFVAWGCAACDRIISNLPPRPLMPVQGSEGSVQQTPVARNIHANPTKQFDINAEAS